MVGLVMDREIITRRPRLSLIILGAGAVAFWLLCQPAIWTRGYPRIEPFWRAMPWLWLVPVFISAVFDDNKRRRNRTLILFGLFSGIVWSGAWGSLITPRNMSLSKMIIGGVFYGPVCIGVTLFLERIWQRFIGKFRQFSDDDRCRKCKYTIRHLTVARCPECGTPFDPRWLNANEGPLEPTARPWRTSAIILIVLAVATSSPFVFHTVMIGRAVRLGRDTARKDWQAGSAVLYFDYFNRAPLLANKASPKDPLSGLPLRPATKGLETESYQSAYNAEIEAELTSVGKAYITQYVFSNEVLESLLNSVRFWDIPELPYVYDGRIQFAEGDQGIVVNGTPVYLDSDSVPRQLAVVLQPERLMILRTGDNFCTLLEDGTPLQFFLAAQRADGKFVVLP